MIPAIGSTNSGFGRGRRFNPCRTHDLTNRKQQRFGMGAYWVVPVNDGGSTCCSKPPQSSFHSARP
jgi:hypothetical protein